MPPSPPSRPRDLRLPTIRSEVRPTGRNGGQVARYGRLDLLLLDELSYLQIDPRGAELLFQIITKREKTAQYRRSQGSAVSKRVAT
jgi:hypothetical protein